jgi:hypothetical protein
VVVEGLILSLFFGEFAIENDNLLDCFFDFILLKGEYICLLNEFLVRNF